MEWELSKENVQPMKSGRSVEVLNEALKAKVEGHGRCSSLESQRRQMLDTIEHYSGSDPLEPWIGCIKWMKDAYPAGGAQSEFVKLLEGCTRKFQKDELYRNDVRYLRVWVQYSDCCTDPTDVFAFLESNDIGQTHALFYEAYATAMEVRRNFSKSDEIYRTGISRKAQPLGRLESMYRGFLKRMVKRGERKMREEQQLMENGSAVDTENQFRSFGPTSAHLEPQHGRQRGRQVPVQTSHSRSNRPKNPKISIYIDPEFEVSRSTSAQNLNGEDPGPSSCHSTWWGDLPAEGDKRKENFQQPTKWTEAKLKQSLPLSHARQSGLDVFVDEEFSDLKRQPKPTKAAAPPILKLRLEDMQSLKRTSPRLKGSFLDISCTALDSANKSSEGPGLTAGPAATHHPRTSVPSILAYDAQMINGNGAERCFEEVRLEVWKENHKGFVDPDPDDTTEGQEDKEFLESGGDVHGTGETVQMEDQNADGTSLSRSDSPTAVLLETEKERTDRGGDPRSYNDASAQGVDNQLGRNNSLDYPVDSSANETASTAAGFTIISGKQSEGILPLVNHSSDRLLSVSDSFSMQGDETIAIKRFADEITVCGADPRVNAIDAASHHGLVEPTINTKECLADILDMFNKPLESDKSRPKTRVPRDYKKRSSNSGGFQIFVDEDLQAKRPLGGAKDEKRVKGSSSHFVGIGQSQGSGFQVYVDDYLDDERPARAGGTLADASSSAASFEKSKAEPGSFKVFQDENVATRPARPKQSKARTEISISSKNFQIFVDDEFCDTIPVQTEERDPSPRKSVDVAVARKSTFKIYEDQYMDLNSSEHRPTETTDRKIKTSSDRSSARFGIFVDEEFRNLSLSERLFEERRADELLQKGPVSPYDKENVADSHVEQAAGDVDVSDPSGQPECTMDGAIEQDKAAVVIPTDRPLPASPPRWEYVTDSVSINPDISVTVVERAQTGSGILTVDPWDEKTLNCLLSRVQTSLSNYEGFFGNNKKYSGPLPTSSVRAGNGRNKIIELGSSTYRLKGCVGEGAFAHVFEAEDEEDDYYDDPPKIALKFQKPACPWEFYIYRQLDTRISRDERHYYGYVRRMHLYTDCSFIVCDYGEKGTLQDVVNAYLALNQRMDEVLCMFYTIEMLRMLEVLHSVGIIHGDIKPDNFLIRDQDDSPESEDWSPEHRGCWQSRGLCLIDWGRSIDITLFPGGTVFHGDCKTDSFRCPEMLERRPWTFQVDTFGLCGVVHCLLHGSYMQIEKFKDAEGQTLYRPKAAFKRYWNVKLWKELFDTLLNIKEFSDKTLLSGLRENFERHLVDNNLGKKLKGLISKQNIMMFTASRR